MVYDKIIQGKTVYLRSATMEDLEFTYEIRQDRERTKYMHAVTGGLEAQRKWLEKQMATPGDYFFVVHSSAGKPIGTYSIYNIAKDGKSGEIGRGILNGDPIQNLEAILLMHDFVFLELGMEKLNVEIQDANTASVGVTKKMGGKRVAHQYSEEFHTMVGYYIIEKEAYLERRPPVAALVSRFAGRK